MMISNSFRSLIMRHLHTVRATGWASSDWPLASAGACLLACLGGASGAGIASAGGGQRCRVTVRFTYPWQLTFRFFCLIWVHFSIHFRYLFPRIQKNTTCHQYSDLCPVTKMRPRGKESQEKNHDTFQTIFLQKIKTRKTLTTSRSDNFPGGGGSRGRKHWSRLSKHLMNHQIFEMMSMPKLKSVFFGGLKHLQPMSQL